MCGILVMFKNPHLIFERILKIKHRGTRSNVMLYDNIGFGHVRLPIQGLNPEFDGPFSTDDEIILYNGEIYNFKEINRDYSCDIQCLFGEIDYSLFDGDFAVVKYNKRTHVMELVTDRFGRKQLYCKIRNNKIIAIASEIKALASEDEDIDMMYMSNVARYGYNFANDRTMYSSIKRFMPGKRYYILRDGTFWLPKDDQISWNSMKLIGDADPKDLYSLLRLSMRRRMVSDVPISILLSGGLDSSLVLHIAKDLEFNSSVYTVQNSDDEKNAERVAEYYGVDLKKVSLDTLEKYYDSAHLACESAVDLGSVIPKYVMFKKIHDNGIKVVLGGTGADEVFGGYKRMKKFDTQYNDIYNELVYYHLPRVEKLSMANTVEYRTPFTADYIIDFALSLPYEQRIDKRYLRHHNELPLWIKIRQKVPLKMSHVKYNEEEERFKLLNKFKSGEFGYET